ncbi:MAG: hypothetical protein FJ029_04145 [Actinobacteria bacterium]|nr:hypothetical protein [Actinomycetota bacterium]
MPSLPLRISYRIGPTGSGPGGASFPPASEAVLAYIVAVRAARERFEGGLDMVRFATTDHLAGFSSWERAAVTADATSQLAASLARELAALEIPSEATTHRRLLVDLLRRSSEASLAYGPGESQAYVASVRVVDELADLLNAYFRVPDDPRLARASLDAAEW